MECELCLCQYDIVIRIPRVLICCGNTVCSVCIEGWTSKHQPSNIQPCPCPRCTRPLIGSVPNRLVIEHLQSQPQSQPQSQSDADSVQSSSPSILVSNPDASASSVGSPAKLPQAKSFLDVVRGTLSTSAESPPKTSGSGCAASSATTLRRTKLDRIRPSDKQHSELQVEPPNSHSNSSISYSDLSSSSWSSSSSFVSSHAVVSGDPNEEPDHANDARKAVGDPSTSSSAVSSSTSSSDPGPRPKALGVDAANGLSCSGCLNLYNKEAYSSKQSRKPAVQRKCKYCIWEQEQQLKEPQFKRDGWMKMSDEERKACLDTSEEDRKQAFLQTLSNIASGNLDRSALRRELRWLLIFSSYREKNDLTNEQIQQLINILQRNKRDEMMVDVFDAVVPFARSEGNKYRMIQCGMIRCISDWTNRWMRAGGAIDSLTLAGACDALYALFGPVDSPTASAKLAKLALEHGVIPHCFTLLRFVILPSSSDHPSKWLNPAKSILATLSLYYQYKDTHMTNPVEAGDVHALLVLLEHYSIWKQRVGSQSSSKDREQTDRLRAVAIIACKVLFECRDLVSQLGPKPEIVRVLRNVIEKEVDAAYVLQFLFRILSAVLLDGSGVATFAAEGGVKLVVAVLKRHLLKFPVVSAACDTLGYLAGNIHIDLHSEICANGGVDVLFMILRIYLRRQDYTQLKLILDAIATFAELSRYQQAKDRFWRKNEGIGLLLSAFDFLDMSDLKLSTTSALSTVGLAMDRVEIIVKNVYDSASDDQNTKMRPLLARIQSYQPIQYSNSSNNTLAKSED